MQLNSIYIAGNLTRPPEIRYTPKGAAVADIGLAANRSWTTESGEKKEEVCFVSVTAWGKTAEAVGKYCKKGDPVLVQGMLVYETWEKNGEKRSIIKIRAERVHFLSYRKDDGHQEDADEGHQPAKRASKQAEGGKADQGATSGRDLEEDDVPF